MYEKVKGGERKYLTIVARANSGKGYCQRLCSAAKIIAFLRVIDNLKAPRPF